MTIAPIILQLLKEQDEAEAEGGREARLRVMAEQRERYWWGPMKGAARAAVESGGNPAAIAGGAIRGFFKSFQKADKNNGPK